MRRQPEGRPRLAASPASPEVGLPQLANVILRLQELGFSAPESTLFAILQTRRLATGSELASAARMTRPQAYRILELLTNKGFVRATAERPARFEAISVIDLVESLKASTLAKVQGVLEASIMLRATVGELGPLGDSGASGQRLSILRRREDIMATFAHSVETAAKSIRLVNLHPRGPSLLQAFGLLRRLIDCAQRGVDVRLLFAAGALSEEAARELAAAGIQVRQWRGEERVGSAVLDEAEAMITLRADLSPGREGPESVALWTDAPAFVGMQVLFFEMAWERCAPGP